MSRLKHHYTVYNKPWRVNTPLLCIMNIISVHKYKEHYQTDSAQCIVEEISNILYILGSKCPSV